MTLLEPDTLTAYTPLDVTRTPNGYRIEAPYAGGITLFLFDDLESRPNALYASVSTWVWAPEVTEEQRFKGRVDLRDLSSESVYRRHVQAMYGGEDAEWIVLFNCACQAVIEAVAEEDLSVDLGTVQADTRTQYVVPPFVLASGPSILFGKGQSCKTYLALAAAVAVAKGERFLGQPTQGGAVLIVDYESNANDTKARILRILAGMGEEWDEHLARQLIYWPGQARPLQQMITALERTIRGQGVRFIIVDSAGLACGGNPKDEDVALGYFNALRRLEIPSLTIAHVTKLPGKDEYPYGSVYWSNSARLTWLSQLDPQWRLPDSLRISLHNRKANEEGTRPPIGVRFSFEGHGRVILTSDEEVVAASVAKVTTSGQVIDALRGGRKSTKELAMELDKSIGTIRTRCNETAVVRKAGKAPDGSSFWELAT